MAKIQELLKGRDERIDYDKIVSGYPWILEKKQKCILSPDSDGLLCGLLMSHLLDWQVKGFYDGKVMVLEKDISASNCIFLDMEVFRKNIRSVGHHVALYNINQIPPNWENFENCIQPNNIRGYDGLHTFRLKYPLATIHLLMGIVGSQITIEIPESAICPLLFTDGAYNVLFSYPENVLNWLKYLRADEQGNPLKTIFENEAYSVFALMKEMDKFFRQRDEVTIPGERGDRFRISTTDGSPYNINPKDDVYEFAQDALDRIKQFIGILAKLTGWDYRPDSWAWSNMKLYRFQKKSFDQDKLSVNGQNFLAMVQRTPLSWAMTSNTNIEYTLEEPDRLD